MKDVERTRRMEGIQKDRIKYGKGRGKKLMMRKKKKLMK
jgi:hypothetical protein